MAYKRRTLEYQSNTIEAVLSRHRVTGSIRGGVVTPRFVKFQLVAQVGTKVSKVSALAEEIAMALGVREARIYRQGSDISVEVPRPEPQPVRLLPLCRRLQRIPSCTSVLGIEDDGTPLLLRLTAADVTHVLVAGTTGSGKTALVRTLLTTLTMFNRQSELQLILIDPKGRGLGPLECLPHVFGDVSSTPEAAEHRLRWLVKEMERRDRENSSRPILVVAIDELADLITTGGKAVEKMLTRLAQRGREAGIHLIACTQKPTAAHIGSSMTANFPVRLVGTVASKDEARYATGVAESGAEKLEGRGDFLLITKGELIRFQSAWIGRADLQTITDRMCGERYCSSNWQEQNGSSPLRTDTQQPVDSQPVRRKRPAMIERFFGG